MEFNGDYLRVITPICGPDGSVLINNGRVVSRETSLPLTARAGLEQENRDFERWGKRSLMHQIQVVSCDPIPDVPINFRPSFMADAKPLIKSYIPQIEPEKAKRGRPKKDKA